MLVIALTGGIGSGKSTVADRLATHGVPVIDADILAREAVAPNSPAIDAIRQAFGEDVIAPDGGIERARLRQRVFTDEKARHQLESILHPKIRQAMRQQLSALRAPYAVLVIPLLLETGQTDLADRILVVDSPEPLQIQRVITRNQLPEKEIRAIIQAQCSRAERLKAADDVIQNDGNLQRLLAQTDHMHAHYLALAAAKTEQGGEGLRNKKVCCHPGKPSQ